MPMMPRWPGGRPDQGSWSSGKTANETFSNRVLPTTTSRATAIRRPTLAPVLVPTEPSSRRGGQAQPSGLGLAHAGEPGSRVEEVPSGPALDRQGDEDVALVAKRRGAGRDAVLIGQVPKRGHGLSFPRLGRPAGEGSPSPLHGFDQVAVLSIAQVEMGEPLVGLVGVVRSGSRVDHGPQKPLGPGIVEGGSHRSAVEGRPAPIECATEPAPVVGLVESAQRGGLAFTEQGTGRGGKQEDRTGSQHNGRAPRRRILPAMTRALVPCPSTSRPTRPRGVVVQITASSPRPSGPCPG